jgi:hypothetical protein
VHNQVGYRDCRFCAATYTNCLGKVYHVLDFEVEMSCTGGSLDFAVYHDGKRQGSKHVVVDYETRS